MAEAAGIPGRHDPHRYRHGLATDLVRRKVDPKTVQNILGHSDLATTSRYLHLDDSDAADSIDALYDEDDLDGPDTPGAPAPA